MSTPSCEQSNRSQANIVGLKNGYENPIQISIVLRIQEWKNSGATLSEEEVVEAANIASVPSSEKQIVEALIFNDRK